MYFLQILYKNSVFFFLFDHNIYNVPLNYIFFVKTMGCFPKKSGIQDTFKRFIERYRAGVFGQYEARFRAGGVCPGFGHGF